MTGELAALVKRIATPVAIIAFVDGLAMWLLSFVPGAPTAAFWSSIVMPAFAAVFFPFAVVVFDASAKQKGTSSLRSGGIPFRGWRRSAVVIIFVANFVSFFAVFASGRLVGQPYERDGRYFDNNHGKVTELTRSRWEDENALSSRLFSGGVMTFAGIAALYLTQRPEEEDEGAPRQPMLPVAAEMGWWRKLRGYTVVSASGPGTREEALGRLATIAVVQGSPTDNLTSHHVLLDWDQPASWPMPAFPLRLEGRLVTAAGMTTLEATLGPATRRASMLPFQGVWGFIVVALGASIFIGAGLPGPAMVVLPIWSAWGGFLSYRMITAPRRIAMDASQRIERAVQG